MEKLLLDSPDKAFAFADKKEAEGFEHVAVITNVDGFGRAQVTWGSLPAAPATHAEIMAEYQRMFDAEEKSRNEKFDKACRRAGRNAAAAELATAKGYTGRDAEVFIDGFSGVPATITNPRAEGREGIFREGRAAYGTADGQRATRVASVKARSTIERPSRFRYSEGLIANGEH